MLFPNHLYSNSRQSVPLFANLLKLNPCQVVRRPFSRKVTGRVPDLSKAWTAASFASGPFANGVDVPQMGKNNPMSAKNGGFSPVFSDQL
jgi:hypothetical protein